MAARRAHPAQLSMFAICGEPLPLFTASKTPAPKPPEMPTPPAPGTLALTLPTDFQSVVAQETAKRALEIALVGRLVIILQGPPSCGKTMLLEAAQKIGDFCGIETRGKAEQWPDLFVQMYAVADDDWRCPPPCESSDIVAERVAEAKARLDVLSPGFHDLADCGVERDENAVRLMLQAAEAMCLNPERVDRTWRVALVIAAMAGAERIGRVHVAEALSYVPRMEERPDWPEGAVRSSHPIHRGDDRPYWSTNAHEWGGEILAYKDRPAPVELTVRGIRTVCSFGMGMATHAVDPPGTPYWSETGFRSFTGYNGPAHPALLREFIEGYIDAPAKDGNGCGGVLSPWWTATVRQLQQHRAYLGRHPDSATGAALEKDAALCAEVRAEGFDPEVVAPWPKSLKQKALAL